MSGYGAGRSIGYTDYYKNNTQTPGDSSNSNLSDSSNSASTPVLDAEKKRKEALRRRLKLRKAGM